MTMLIAVVALTLVAALAAALGRRSEQRKLAALARQWHMHFSPRDVFQLADRVAPHLPQTGAATVRVRDCIYGNEPGGHRYLFRAEYTVGVTRSKHRHWCIVSVLEPKRRDDPALWQSLRFADASLPAREQYVSLYGESTAQQKDART